ncbi:unnamed protein product [Amaranthus hypochondriacus]
MAPSFDYSVSNLLCAEDNTSIFDEVDDNYIGDDFEICSNWQNGNLRNFHNQDCNFFGLNEDKFSGFFLQTDECLSSMFEKERKYFLGLDYLNRLSCGDLDLAARNQAIDWIQKVQFHYNFGPLCAYLSVNYLDRFLSAYELPKGKTWMMQLLAVACLSVAAKMDETDVPLSLDLQVCDSKFVFESKTIQRMELLVLSTLEWRMQSVTPFSFIDYFLYKLNGDVMPPKSLIFKATQLILSTIKGIDLMEFRPSVIASAVAICVTQETQTGELTDKAFSFLTHQVQKEEVMKCVEILNEKRIKSRSKGCSGGGIASTSVPQSPNGVLDAGCLSYKTDETSTLSATNSAPKRRKLHH